MLKKITENQLEAIQDIFDGFISDEWLMLHTEIELEDVSNTVTIRIDDLDDQEYVRLRNERASINL